MPDQKDQEISTVDPSSASKDKKSSSTDGMNWEDMMSDSDIPTRSGGSSIPAVSSSTSKLSADLGVTPEVFKQMHETKLNEALAMLLQARGSSSSTASGSNASIKAKHDALIHKFALEFIQEDAFEKLNANPKAFYGMKAFLVELQVPMTSKPMLSVITQIEAHIDQYAKDLQRFLNNEEQVKAQRLAQVILWEKANISNAKWTVEIQELQIKIAELECKIVEEKAKQQYLESKTAEISQVAINKETRDSIEHFSSAKVIDEAIIRLNEDNEVLAEKMK
ncbi:hypothetical protein A2U01_0019636, partial [Trifolium medium]|nr:hypothetical protein [Trifolium medium]